MPHRDYINLKSQQSVMFEIIEEFGNVFHVLRKSRITKNMNESDMFKKWMEFKKETSLDSSNDINLSITTTHTMSERINNWAMDGQMLNSHVANPVAHVEFSSEYNRNSFTNHPSPLNIVCLVKKNYHCLIIL